MMLCSNVGLENAAKYGCCRNQPSDVHDSEEAKAGADCGDCGALMFGASGKSHEMYGRAG